MDALLSGYCLRQDAFDIPQGLAFPPREDDDLAGAGGHREEVLVGACDPVGPVGVDRGDLQVTRPPAELEGLDPPALVADDDAREIFVHLVLGHTGSSRRSRSKARRRAYRSLAQSRSNVSLKL